ncbi:hypothetical protein VKT23_002557 [Stygiomarasmius scandens]|uniref:Uncharacterized protein n=1 Tax=Marasmiellus scandens TaxID=2682957 RepID=A0ABR1K4Y3_9AGAR
MIEMIKSLTDDAELETFIEAIPHSVYNNHQNKVREQNARLFMPLLHDSEQNIWSCIKQFAAKSEYWTDVSRTRRARVCAQAIWALVQVYVTAPEDSGDLKNAMDSVASAEQKLFLQSMPSLLKILAATSDGDDSKSKLYFALITLGIQWINMLELETNQATKEQLENFVLEIFQAVSPYADKLEVSGASLDMILAALKVEPQVKSYSKIGDDISAKDEERDKEKDKEKAQEDKKVIINIRMPFLGTDKPKPPSKIDDPNTEPPPKADEPDDLNPTKLLPVLHCRHVLPALKKHFDGNPGSALDEYPDALIRWSLRIPLHHKNASGCRQFVLQYFHKKHQGNPSALDVWKGEALECIGQYVLKEMQNVESKQFDICMDISVILLASASHSPNKREFYTGLFGILPTLPSSGAERKKRYLLLKTLLDLVVCIRLVPPSRFYEPLPKNFNSELAPGEVALPYLHWELSRLNTLDGASFRDTLAVAIVSHYIELCCQNELSPRDGVLKRLGYALSVKPKVEEDVQVMFAENVAKLWQTGPETESVKSTLLDVIGFVNIWGPFSSKWITSQSAAKALSDLDGLLLLTGQNDLRTGEIMRPWKRLLEHCQKMASPNSNVPSGST